MSCHHHHHHQHLLNALPPSPEQDPALPDSSSGYRKITLPLLRRCISDPYNHPSFNPLFEHYPCGGGCSGGGSLPNMTPPHYSPDHHHHYPIPKTPSHSPTVVLPPLPPSQTLRRSVSDVNPSPSKSSPFSTSSQDLGSDIDTPNSKRLRRMKDRLREMSLWCQQLMQDEEFMEVEDQDEEQVVEEEEQEVPAADATDQDFHSNAAATNEDDCEKVFAESVSVEKKDDCLIIHFRCNCDKAYQFLLSGGECFYKLM